MAIWTVFEHDRFGSDARIAERAVFVRDGFSCLAFLFGPLWLLAHRMVVVLIGCALVAGAAYFAASQSLGDDTASLILLVLALWFAFEATALRRWALVRRGWRLVAVVEAPRRVDAERRYYTDRLTYADPGHSDAATSAHPTLPWGPAPEQPVLGLFPDGPR